MLLALLPFIGVAAATRFCISYPNQVQIPTCTDSCLAGDEDTLDGVCADNIIGICELDGGVASFFRVYSDCLRRSCPDSTDRQRFITTFQMQCGWYSQITDEQASYFGIWQQYLNKQGTTHITMTMTRTIAGDSTAVSSATMNGGDGPDAYSSAVETELPLYTSALQTMTAPQTTTESSQSPKTITKFATDVSATTKSTVIGYGTPANSQTSSSALSYSSGSSAPTNHEKSMSPAVIAGIAVASIAILGSFVVAAFFLSRRFQRRHHGRSAETPPPLVHEPNKGRPPYEKAELDAKHSEVGFGAPVGHAELDGGSPVSPIYEPVHVRASERRARIAQNF